MERHLASEKDAGLRSAEQTLSQGTYVLRAKCKKVAEDLAEAGLHAEAVASACLHLYLEADVQSLSVDIYLQASLAQVAPLVGPLDDLTEIAQDRVGLQVVANQDSMRPRPTPAQEAQDLLPVLVLELLFVGQGNLRLRTPEEPGAFALRELQIQFHFT